MEHKDKIIKILNEINREDLLLKIYTYIKILYETESVI